MSSTIFIAIIWIWLFMTCAGLGLGVRSLFGLSNQSLNFPQLFQTVWWGWAASLCLLQIWHLFLPVTNQLKDGFVIFPYDENDASVGMHEEWIRQDLVGH